MKPKFPDKVWVGFDVHGRAIDAAQNKKDLKRLSVAWLKRYRPDNGNEVTRALNVIDDYFPGLQNSSRPYNGMRQIRRDNALNPTKCDARSGQDTLPGQMKIYLMQYTKE